MAKQIVIFGRFPSCDFARRQSARRTDGNIMAPLTEATPGRRFSGHNSRPLPGTTSTATAILEEIHHQAIPTVCRPKIEAKHRGELFVGEPLHISVNHYYGPHGYSDGHGKRIPINLPHDEDFPHGDFPHGPVRILMRDGQRLPEPELVEAREMQNRHPHPVSWRSSRRQAGFAIYNMNDTLRTAGPCISFTDTERATA